MPPVARRAWTLLAISAAVFCATAVVALYAVDYVLDHATATRTATAVVTSGSGALWRTDADAEWRLFDGAITLSEGNEISTDLGTVVWVTFFDGSTLEISERSRVEFERLRVSRFRKTTKQILVKLFHGKIYGAMAPRGAYDYAEYEVSGESATAVMSDGRAHSGEGAFLVEGPAPEVESAELLRVGVFHGTMQVSGSQGSWQVTGPGQVSFEPESGPSESNRITGELITNGDFAYGLDNWEVVYSSVGREPPAMVGRASVVEVEAASAQYGVEIYRAPAPHAALTGIRQEIERTLRHPSSLTLTFDIKIRAQGDPIDGIGTVPIGLELSYVDILGQERIWRTAYTTERDQGQIEADLTSVVIPNTWTHIIFDLNNLEPIPRFLHSIVVYANGAGYQSFVTNVSLTTGEGATAGT